MKKFLGIAFLGCMSITSAFAQTQYIDNVAGWKPIFQVRTDMPVMIGNAGTGNVVNDVITINDGCNPHVSVTVASVNSKGGVTGATVSNTGLCSAANPNYVGQISTTGHGINATFEFTYAPQAISNSTNGAILLDTYKSVVDIDDTNSFTRAIASGVPTLLGPKTYIVNGDVLVNNNFTLFGIPGVSKVVATSTLPTGANGSWFRITAPSVVIDGTIFDEGGFGATNNIWMFKAQPTVTNLNISRSAFRNAGGVLGYCFQVNADATPTDNPFYRFNTDEFSGCSRSGLKIEQALNTNIISPQAFNNLNSGIEVNYALGVDTNLNQRISIVGGQAYNNAFSGVLVGNFVQVASTPPVYGNGVPSVAYMSITGMTNYGNNDYGIQVANNNIALTGNILTGNAVGQPDTSSAGGGGILFSCQYCSAVGNVIDNNGYYAIDAGGSFEALIEGNQLSNMGLGVNAGATIGISIKGNKFWNFTDKAVNVPAMDSGGLNVAFPQVTSHVFITDNDIEMSSMSLSSYAIFAVDDVQDLNVNNNAFRYSQTAYNAGMRPNLAMTAITDNVNVSGNCVTMPIRAGQTTQLTCGTIFDVNPTGGSNWLVIPDVLTDVRPNGTNFVIGNISPNTSFLHSSGEVSWVNITANGSGYNPATTTVVFGGPGSGITAAPYIWNGQVIGIAMLTRGTGATGSTTVSLVDSSGGTGATATAQIDVPIPRNSKVKIHAKATGTLNTTGSFTAQATPTGNNILLPAGTVVTLAEQGSFVANGAGGAWNAEDFYSTLTGTSSAIGGSSLAAGACATAAVTITGAATTMAVNVAPVANPGSAIYWSGYVSAANTVTVNVCAAVAATPTSTTYNVRVIQ